MIRIVLWTLVSLNAALLIWQITRPGESPTAQRGPEPGVKTLVMLHERDAPPEGESSERPASSQTVVTAPGSARCYTLGPFRSQDGAARAREAMLEMDLKPTGRVRNEREQYGFQVYLPPFEDRDKAIQAARSLAAKGITEYYIMNEEQLRNAISLGLFRSKSHAERHIEQLKDSDVYAEILPRYRERKLYWLDYRDESERLSGAAIRQLFAEDPVQRLARSCS